MPIDARIPLQGVPFQPPKFDLGETYTAIARIQALEEQRRGQAISNRGAARAIGREEAWDVQMAQVFAPPQQAPPQGSAAQTPTPPQGLTAPPPTMADQVPFASPPQGQYGLTAPPMPQGMPQGFTRAPSTMQAPTMIPGAMPQGLTAPQGPPPGMPPGPPPVGLAPGAQGPPPPPSPPQGLTAQEPQARKPGPFAQLVQPLNMEALQQAYAIDPDKTAQWVARHTQMQGQKLAQAKQMTSAMYSVGKRVLASDTPQKAYEIGMQQLRDQGIPLPKDLPPTYDPAWMAYTVESLRTTDIELAELKVKQEQQELQLKTYTAQTERGKMLNEGAQLAQAGEGVRKYTGEKKLDAAIAATHPDGVPPGGMSAAIQKAERYLQDMTVEEKNRIEQGSLQGRKDVASAHGLDAARLERTEKPLEGEAAKAVSELTTLRTMTDDLAALYKPAYAGWANRLGLGTAREKVGAMEAEEAAFRATAQDIQDMLGRLRSGAVIRPDEMRTLEALAPGAKTAPNLFPAQLQRFQRALEQTRESRLRVGTTGRGQLREETRPTTPRVGGASPSQALGRPVAEMSPAERLAERDALLRKR